MKLKGKVAIVTGAGRGIGCAIAEGFALAGASLILTAAREKRELDETAERLNALGILADVSRDDDVEGVVQAALQRFGHIDILVNNAGRGMKYVSPSFMTEPTRFWEIDPKIWRMVIDTNVTGVFLMTRAVVPYLLKQGWGRIINVSMNYETMKRKGFSPYGPSKAALESMSIIWAQELEGTGITVNRILPGGATDTGMIPEGTPEKFRLSLLKPEIIVPPAVYLASDESDGVTGQRIIALEWRRQCSQG
jgi:NAD(P)-dependent dehydrogenase (short-subunit alcohol dehydrogenase family)